MSNWTFTDETYDLLHDRTLRRVVATETFTVNETRVVKGTLGGWVEKSSNLSANSFVFDEAMIFGDAHVGCNTVVANHARIFGHARVEDCCEVGGHAQVYDNVLLMPHSKISESAIVHDNAVISDASVMGGAEIFGNSFVGNQSAIFECAKVGGNAKVIGCEARIDGHIYLDGETRITHRYDCIQFREPAGARHWITHTLTDGLWHVCVWDHPKSTKELMAIVHNKNMSEFYSSICKLMSFYASIDATHSSL